MTNIEQIDVTHDHGTFRVTTESGGEYLITTSGNEYAVVTVSGGSNHYPNREAVILNNPIAIDKQIRLGFDENGKLRTVPTRLVSHIHRMP